MARTVDRVNRISGDFDALDAAAQVDMVAELFTRLDAAQASDAMKLMSFWCKRFANSAGRGKDAWGCRINPDTGAVDTSPVPPLMERGEVEAAGKLALAPVPKVKQ